MLYRAAEIQRGLEQSEKAASLREECLQLELEEADLPDSDCMETRVALCAIPWSAPPLFV